MFVIGELACRLIGIHPYKKHPQHEKNEAEYFIIKKGKEYKPFSQSINITKLIFERIKTTLPDNTQLLGFSADMHDLQSRFFQEMFNNQSCEFTMIPAKFINKGKWNKEIVYSKDGYHWNHRGHELVANGLIEFLEK